MNNKKAVVLGLQHLFSCIGATILVPILVGMSPSAALFTAGIGTLMYLIITQFKVPNFVGSSFAFIPSIILISSTYGFEYMLGGIVASGLFYVIIAAIIKKIGTKWIDKVLSPVVIGSVIVIIGLSLAPTAVSMASNGTNGVYSLPMLLIAVVTLISAVVANLYFKGFISAIPILIGLVIGYIFTIIMGALFPSFDIVDISIVKNTPWFSLPHFYMPKFSSVAILTFVIVSFATICEHLGHVLVTSKVVGKDFTKDPGLHRTLTGDGVATAISAFFGGVPNTTYGESIAVLSITRIFNIKIFIFAAISAIILSLFGKFGAIIQTIPAPVIGGISILLFGIIASSGLRTMVESGIDFKNKRNLTIASIILSIGIGGGRLAFIIGGFNFELAGIALATLVGIVLNLVLPEEKN
jgi:uracil permease